MCTENGRRWSHMHLESEVRNRHETTVMSDSLTEFREFYSMFIRCVENRTSFQKVIVPTYTDPGTLTVSASSGPATYATLRFNVFSVEKEINELN